MFVNCKKLKVTSQVCALLCYVQIRNFEECVELRKEFNMVDDEPLRPELTEARNVVQITKDGLGHDGKKTSFSLGFIVSLVAEGLNIVSFLC